MEAMANNGGEENARSTASVISYGKVRIAAFGDLTWDREKDLFCPIDKVGKVDVYLATHHGTALSGSPAAVNALAPIVAIVGNGARKGADAARMKTIKASPRIQGVWQLHTTTVAPEVECRAGDDRQHRTRCRPTTRLIICACASRRAARSP